MSGGDRLGRTIVITLLAAALFGAFLLVAPKLTASGGRGAVPDTGGTTATPTTVVTAPITITTTSLPALGSTTTLPATTTTTAPSPGWNPEAMTPAAGYDGSIRIVPAASGPEAESIADGDTLTWRVHVVNTTAGELWGVFAWVEGFGRAYCDSHHLDAGASTDCWATGTAYAGVQRVVAWVNAWTEVRQVKDKVLMDLVVAA
jgi:hypothetical protein